MLPSVSGPGITRPVRAQFQENFAMLLTDKVAVITGVNSGIGRKTAELFAQQGAKIAGVDIRTDRMDELKDHVESLPSPRFSVLP